MMIVGDFNNVVNPAIDVIRTGPAQANAHDQEDVTEFIDMLAERGMIDTYLSLRSEVSGPMMMTNSSHHGDSTTYKRLDKWYQHPSLDHMVHIDHMHSRYNNTTPVPLDSSRSPVEMTLIERSKNEMRIYHHNWKMNSFVATQQKHKTKILKMRDELWTECKNQSKSKKSKAMFKLNNEIAKYLKEVQEKTEKKQKKEMKKLQTN